MIPRVPLYGPEPLGIGTPLVESLTGFIGRQAKARHLPASTVFDGLIRPNAPKGVVRETLGLSRSLATSAVVYDGLGRPAEELVRVLTGLTGLENLALHTLIPWRPLIAPTHNGALRYQQKRWCASCFVDWRARRLDLWEPLLWRLAPVRRCPIHRTPFSDACPNRRCRASQGLIQEIAPLGACRKCRRNLDAGDEWVRKGQEAFLENEQACREWWTSVQVGRMLAFQGTLASFASAQGFSRLLKESASPSGRGSIRRLVEHLGTDRATTLHWLHGQRLPNLESFLWVCMRLRSDPLQVAISPECVPQQAGICAETVTPPFWPPIRRGVSRSPAVTRDSKFWKQVSMTLRGLIEGQDVGRMSATQVAISLGISSHTLRRRYPTEYAQLRVIHEAYRRRASERTFAERQKSLRAAVLECVRAGEYPSIDRVFRHANVSKNLASLPEYKRAFLEARREHGFEDA